jgi:molybdopterin-containing oxidoreductase family molybdopterin binding subunit
MPEESFVYTACPGWGDHDYCALKTIVKEGRIVRTEKVIYSGPEACEGHICQKGLLAGRQPYNKERLLYPLKRAGERGEGMWERISWDQALDEIADKMRQIIEESGPEAIVQWSLPAGVPPSFGLGQVLYQRFSGLLGTTDPIVSQGLDNGPVFSSFYTFNAPFVNLLHDPANYVGADVVLIWGCNPIENQMRCARNLVQARDAGAKIIDIGLVFDGSAGWADEFVGPTAGTDAWLAAAMCCYIIEEGLADEDFITRHSVAAYLVRDDTGRLYQDADGNYALWDEAASAPVPVAPKAAELPLAKPALLGNHTIDGVAVTTAYQLLKEHLAAYTLEAAGEKTGLDPARIARLAREYAEADNAYIITGYGMRYMNAHETCRLLHLLGTLTGNYGRPGAGVAQGLQAQSYPIMFNDGAIVLPHGVEGCKINAVRMHEFFLQAASDSSPYRAFIKTAGNPVHQQPDRNRWLKVFSKMDLIVDFDIWMTDTGELADYVLPDCMPFEREEIIASACYNHVVLQEPAIEPQGEARNAVYLFSELAKRLDLGEYFDKSTSEWLAVRLETDDPSIAGLEPKLTYERLKAEKMVRSLAPDLPKFDPFIGLRFDTATGRIEFYAERLCELGLALPRPLPCFASPVAGETLSGTADELPYQLFTGRQRFFMQSMYTDDPINVSLSGGSPSTRMNPRDVAAVGLSDGDKVEVFNDLGHVVTNLEVDESVPAGTVHVWFGWRRRQFEEGTYSEMVTPIGHPDVIDKVADKWWQDWLELGGDARTPVGFIGIAIGAFDTYWDSACNVRKYVPAASGREA